jgi:hypothetical protein
MQAPVGGYNHSHGENDKGLLQRVGELEKIASEETIDLGPNHQFNSAQEVEEWMRKHKVASCDFAWDLMSTLIVVLGKNEQMKLTWHDILTRQLRKTTWLLQWVI